ncbi:MAG: ABC transporter substrate-binding protein [Thermoplasmatota archaeon]
MRFRYLAFTVFLLIPFLFMAGCIDDAHTDGDLRFRDPLGADVVLDRYPERIVTLSPALTETVFALGLGSLIVGTDDMSNYPDGAGDLPDVFTYLGLDPESLISVDPDLVIMDKTLDISEEAYNSIRDLGIPVYRIYPRNVSEVLEAINGIGTITGASEAAEEMVEDLLDRMTAVQTEVSVWKEEQRPKVLLVSYYDGTGDPWVSTDSTMAGGLIETAGGRNVIADDSGIVVQVPVETIVGADPDIIICTQSEVWPTPTRDTILADDGWKDIGAVVSGRVFEVDGDLVDRTGPRFIHGLETIHDRISDYVGE